MTKQIKKDKVGRPKKVAGTNKYEFDEDKIELLASKFWNMSEIAAFYNVDESTIRGRFPNLMVKGREKGKARLRDMQLAAAQKGNVTMLIFLGKNYLGQRDVQDVKHSGSISDPLVEKLSQLSIDELRKLGGLE